MNSEPGDEPYLERLAQEKNLFLWRMVIPIVIFVFVLVSMLAAPYSGRVLIAIFVPTYLVLFSMVASGVVRFARFLGYDEFAIPWIVIGGLPTAGVFPIVFLLSRSRSVERQAAARRG